MSKFVTATYKNRASAEHATDELASRGFPLEDISVLMSNTTKGREFNLKETNKLPEGATAGALTGGTLGAVVAGLVAVGTVAAPGVGLFASGPIVAALAGAGAGGAAGGAIGALAGAGIKEHEAKVSMKGIEDGQILLGVYAHDDRKETARKIFKETGGEHIG